MTWLPKQLLEAAAAQLRATTQHLREALKKLAEVVAAVLSLPNIEIPARLESKERGAGLKHQLDPQKGGTRITAGARQRSGPL
jgi:hypothetical protein